MPSPLSLLWHCQGVQRNHIFQMDLIQVGYGLWGLVP